MLLNANALYQITPRAQEIGVFTVLTDFEHGYPESKIKLSFHLVSGRYVHITS